MQRTKRSIINVLTTVGTNFIILFTAFAVQRTLVITMGTDYNGVNGLFSSILSMLSLTDMGIGTAIICHMYKPVAERNFNRINSLLRFYKLCYIGISGMIMVIGLAISCFLPELIGETTIHDNIYLIFGLFLFDCLCTYFLAYRKSLLYADLMSHVADLIYFAVYLVQNVLQIYVLLVFRSYILFLIIKSLGKIVANIFISVYIRNKYPFIKTKRINPLDKETQKDIFQKVRGLIFHKMGKILVTGSDSLVITGVLGIAAMSLYTNYHLIISGVLALFIRIFETLTNSVGNFLIHSTQEGRLDIYKKIDFLNFWCFGCMTIGMYAVIQPLVLLWMGEAFLLDKQVIFVLAVNFYLEGARASVATFKESAGIFHPDRRIPLIEALFNLAFSIIFARSLGMAGVFLGTVFSSGIVFLYSYPRYVCRPLFGMNYWEYVSGFLKHLSVILAALLLTEGCIRCLETWNPWIRFLLSGTLAVLIFHGIFFVIYGRCEELKYYIKLLYHRIWEK